MPSFLLATHGQRKHASKIIANLTASNADEPSLQTQQSVQDTIQRHFSQILKNDSITVTDNTSITETILRREQTKKLRECLEAENDIRELRDLDSHPLTPPMSNDEENKRPLVAKNRKRPSKKEAKAPSASVQYRILPRGQPDDGTPMLAVPDKHADSSPNSTLEPFLNLTNSSPSSTGQPFRFHGPRCWTQFRLNRSEVSRCLDS